MQWAKAVWSSPKDLLRLWLMSSVLSLLLPLTYAPGKHLGFQMLHPTQLDRGVWQTLAIQDKTGFVYSANALSCA